MPVLATRYRVIAPDSRGHGRTDNPAGRLAYDLMAEDVAGLIDALDLDRPLVAGYSDGAQIALELALRHPDRSRAVVLRRSTSPATGTRWPGSSRPSASTGESGCRARHVPNADHSAAEQPLYWAVVGSSLDRHAPDSAVRHPG